MINNTGINDITGIQQCHRRKDAYPDVGSRGEIGSYSTGHVVRVFQMGSGLI
jgi:hypothetical protein